MTRINANIKPKDLIDQHLLAEYREIVRIPNHVKKNTEAVLKRIKDLPPTFTLNTGHVIFFYNKIEFLHKRFLALKEELTIREIKNEMHDEMFLNIPSILYTSIDDNDLIDGNKLIVERILLRISTMKKTPTIKGIPINFDEYQKHLLNNYDNKL